MSIAPGVTTSKYRQTHAHRTRKQNLEAQSAAAIGTTKARRTLSTPFHQLNWLQAKPASTNTGPRATAIAARRPQAILCEKINQIAGGTRTRGITAAQMANVNPSLSIHPRIFGAIGLSGSRSRRQEDNSTERMPTFLTNHIISGIPEMRTTAITHDTGSRNPCFLGIPSSHTLASARASTPTIQQRP